MRGAKAVWLVFVCAVLVLPSTSRQQDGTFVRVDDGGNHVGWAGLEAQTSSQLSFSPGIESGGLLHHHHHHHSPPPPSPPPPPPPPPPLPPISLNTLEIVNGFLVPRFDPDVHLYKTTVGDWVSEVRVTVSVPSYIQRYKLRLNSSKLISGEESQPIPIGANGETVDFVITISAPGLSNNSYYLSVYRVERSSIWGRIVKRSLLVVVLILLISGILYISDLLVLRVLSCLPFAGHQRRYDLVNSGP